MAGLACILGCVERIESGILSAEIAAVGFAVEKHDPGPAAGLAHFEY
jgi:hypothetical protein